MRTVAAICLLLFACKDADSTKPTPSIASAPSPPPSLAHSAARPPHLPSTASTTTKTTTWSRAETDPTPANWDAAGDELAADLVHCTSDCDALAKRAVTARKNALLATGETYTVADGEAPVPLPPRVSSLVAAMDDYAKYADPSDPDVPKYSFIAASTMYRYRQQSDAIARCEAILRDHRDTEIAEYAANELLDLLSTANRTADLRFWVTNLLADSHFLEGKATLRETLVQLRTRLESPG